MALIGKVVAMTGVAYLITDNGTKRELHLGDQIQTGDTIQTPRGVDVDLELASGRVIHISAEQLVAFTEELSDVFVPDGLDNAVNLATIETVIKAIEEGKDVNAVLEETAAGANGQLNSYGFSFVDLFRINDILNAFNFAYSVDSGRNVNSELIGSDDNNYAFMTDREDAGAGLPAIPNNAPVALSLAIGRDEGSGMIVGSLPASDVDGDALVYSPTGGALPAGLVINSNGSFTFDYSNPAYDYLALGAQQVLVVPYEVSDGKGGTSSSTLTITIDGTNDAPAAVTSSSSGAEDATSIAVTLSGTDVDGTIASITLSTLPTGGTLYTDAALSIPAVTGTAYLGSTLTLYFVPVSNFNGNPSFTYTVTDNLGLSDSTPATATITVNPVNDAPVATNGSNSTNEDTAVTGTLATGTDVDGDTVSIAAASVGTFTTTQGGTIVVLANGSYTYTPAADFNGTDSFAYSITDGTATTPASLNITVNPIDDLPVAVDDVINVTEDTPLSGSLAGNDTR
ncbi:MAG: retention module-containing protein, partial [Methylotenera sp.]